MKKDTEIPYLADIDVDPALTPLQAAARTYCIVLGPRAGQRVLTWKDPSLRFANPEAPQPQGCVSAQGFSFRYRSGCLNFVSGQGARSAKPERSNIP